MLPKSSVLKLGFIETNDVNKRYLKLGHNVGISATHTFSDRIAIKALALLEKKGRIVKSDNTYFDYAKIIP